MEDQRDHWAQTAKYGALASVIDPYDRLGHKNRYIAQLRDGVFKRNLPTGQCHLLDFGCGSGNLSKTLARPDRKVTGVDITPELLEFAVGQNDPELCTFLHYDGGALPVPEASFDYALTYVVLNHIVDDAQLTETLRNVRDTLKADGKALFVEQTRRVTTTTERGIKKQRSVADFSGIFRAAGFRVARVEYLRKARFAPIYLIRYGLLPSALFPLLASVDSALARLFSRPRTSYVDTLFVLEKDSDD